MCADRTLTIYIHDALRQQVAAGRHRFLNTVSDVMTARGFTVDLGRDSAANRQKSVHRPGFALFHMKPPFHDRALSFRKTYLDPFWTIQRTENRWAFSSAKTRFDPAKIDPDLATRFVGQQRQRHFSTYAPTGDDGFIYVPLQGKLTTHRAFQSVSPVEMLKQTAQRFHDRPVVATLHPNESYGTDEHAALNQLLQDHANLQLSDKQPPELLPRCHMVVTQNSGLAFFGYFFEKPAVLFAQVDFHHIAANVGALGIDGAFEAAQSAPDPTPYLFWFLQRMSINASRKNAAERILATLQSHGWPV